MKESLKNKIYEYPTKYKEGFINSEIEKLLSEYPNINMEKFYGAMRGNTCMLKDDEIISYHCDVLTALRCGLENRDMYYHEFD